MRVNQKARTRQAIVRAAGALLRDGRKPSLEEIAEAAQVSRATAYRYFPGLDALLSDRACRSRELPLRLMLARMLERSADTPNADDGPPRQNRRQPLIEEALAPLAPRLGKANADRLSRALAMIVGTEGFIALKDVGGLDESEAREVRRWAIDALVAAALAEAEGARRFG